MTWVTFLYMGKNRLLFWWLPIRDSIGGGKIDNGTKYERIQTVNIPNALNTQLEHTIKIKLLFEIQINEKNGHFANWIPFFFRLNYMQLYWSVN